MKRNPRNLRPAALLLMSALFLTAFAGNELAVGDALPQLSLKDQHDAVVELPRETRRILFAADNDAANLIADLLDRRGPTWLDETKTVYLADIHKMPGLISRWFALPKLREKAYPILLGYEAHELSMFPRKKNCVTFMILETRKITAARFVCSADELRSLAETW